MESNYYNTINYDKKNNKFTFEKDTVTEDLKKYFNLEYNKLKPKKVNHNTLFIAAFIIITISLMSVYYFKKTHIRLKSLKL